jgi:hypothetical protein
MTTKRSHEEMEAHMLEIFRLMDNAVQQYRLVLDGFDQGHAMHAAARKVAPKWLQAWDDKHRWLICFAQGWKGLVSMAKEFRWSKEMLLDDLIYYESLHDKAQARKSE